MSQPSASSLTKSSLILFVRRPGISEAALPILPPSTHLTLPDYRVGAERWTLPSYSAIYPDGVVPVGEAPLTASNGILTHQVKTRLTTGPYAGRWQVTFSAAMPPAGDGTPNQGAGKLTLTDTVTGLQGYLFATYFQELDFHPHTHTQARYWRFTTFRETQATQGGLPPNGNVFTPPAVPYLALDNSDGLITRYEARNEAGQLVASGPVNGSGSIYFPEFTRFGAYHVWLRGGNPVAPFGDYVADTYVILAPDDAASGLFAVNDTLVFTGQPVENFEEDALVRCWAAAAGPPRITVADAAHPDLAKLAASVILYKRFYASYRDGSPRPNCPLFVNFVSLDATDPAQAAGVTAVVRALTPLGVSTYMGKNEPNGNPGPDYAPQMVAFAAAVHAGDSSAKAAGVESVAVYHPNLDALFTSLGPGVLDAVSSHFYNAIAGDYDMGLRTLCKQKEMLTRTGYGSVPYWMTEQGVRPAEYGVMTPARARQQWAAQMMVADHFGIPPGYLSYWHSYGGFNEHQTHLENTNNSYNVVALWLRRRAVEALEASVVSSYYFGRGGDSLWCGNRLDGFGKQAGQSVSIFWGKGTLGGVLKLVVSGASIPVSLTCADACGNETVCPVVSGIVTLPPGDGNVCYVRHATALTLTPSGTDYGANLALGIVPTVPTMQQDAHLLTDGVSRNGYDRGLLAEDGDPFSSDSHYNASGGAIGGSLAGDTPFPYSIVLPGLPRAGRVILRGNPVYQCKSGIIDAVIETRTLGGAWTAQGRISQPANTQEIPCNPGTYAALCQDYYPGAYTFNVLLSVPVPEPCDMRITVIKATPGGQGDFTAAGYGGQPSMDTTGRQSPSQITFSQIEVYAQ